MGGWISIIISAIPIYLFWKSGSIILFIITIINLVINFWSFGIMHNFYYRVYNVIRQRNSNLRINIKLNGRLDKQTETILDRHDKTAHHTAIDQVPDWITHINLATSCIGLILLITSVII